MAAVLFPTHLLVAVGIGWLARRWRRRAAVGAASPSATRVTAGSRRGLHTLTTNGLLVGAALPDVVDKPLGMLGVLDVYQSVGHSLVLAPLAVVLAATHRHGVALAVGWVSHLALDAGHMAINGRADDVLFLAWPVVSRPDPLAIPPGEFARYYAGSPSLYIEVLLWLGALVVLARSRVGVDGGEE